MLPARAQRGVRALRRFQRRTPVAWVRLGDLKRVVPISREFGYERGQPVDRYYVESFLARHAGDIRGHVLEVKDNSYTRKFGVDRVVASDVFDVTEGNPRATIVGDLTGADHLPSDTFDCVILAQTLHLIYDIRLAVETLHRTLKPGGVLLATFPGVSQIGHKRPGDYWYWSFTRLLARRVFGEVFPAANVEVETYGNVLAATALLHGLATQELLREKLDLQDPDYEVLVTLRAVKPGVAAS